MKEIEILASRELLAEDMQKIQEIFEEENINTKMSERVIIRRGIEELPPELVFFLGALAKGFLEAIGKDVWNQCKRAIGKVTSFLKEKYKQEPQISLEVTIDGKENITAIIPTKSEEVMAALNKLPEYLDKISGQERMIWFNYELDEWGTFEDVERWRSMQKK